MKMKSIVLLVISLLLSVSCSDNHTEPEENENPDNTTIYDLFPNYSRYEAPYLKGRVILENISTKEIKEFALDNKGKLIDEVGSEWGIPNNSPYLFNEQFNAIRLIMPNEVCYKEALRIYPNYFYYQCLLIFENTYELENITSKEVQQFNNYEAERQLRNPNTEWGIPQTTPYIMNFNSGLSFVRISDVCKYLNNK